MSRSNSGDNLFSFFTGRIHEAEDKKETLLVPKASGEARCVWFTNLSVTEYYAARWVKTFANRGFFYRVVCSFVKTAGLN